MSANTSDFIDISLQLPGAENIKILDKQGNMIKPKTEIIAASSVQIPKNSTLMDVPNPDKEFYRKKKQQKILQLQKLLLDKDTHLLSMKSNIGKMQHDILILQNLYSQVCLDNMALDRMRASDLLGGGSMMMSTSGLLLDQTLEKSAIRPKNNKRIESVSSDVDFGNRSVSPA